MELIHKRRLLIDVDAGCRDWEAEGLVETAGRRQPPDVCAHRGSSRRLARRRKDAPVARFPDSRIDATRLSSQNAFALRLQRLSDRR
jgi:hypothetical protein